MVVRDNRLARLKNPSDRAALQHYNFTITIPKKNVFVTLAQFIPL